MGRRGKRSVEGAAAAAAAPGVQTLSQQQILGCSAAGSWVSAMLWLHKWGVDSLLPVPTLQLAHNTLPEWSKTNTREQQSVSSFAASATVASDSMPEPERAAGSEESGTQPNLRPFKLSAV